MIGPLSHAWDWAMAVGKKLPLWATKWNLIQEKIANEGFLRLPDQNAGKTSMLYRTNICTKMHETARVSQLRPV